MTVYSDNDYCHGGDFYLLDTQHGWATVDRTFTMNSFWVDMFQTSDGRKTWYQIGGAPYGTFRFSSLSEGWMSAMSCTGAPPQLYYTQDGGKTWKLALGKEAGLEDDFSLPVFRDPRNGIVLAIVRYKNSGENGLTLFTTSDGGKSWQVESQVKPPTDGFDRLKPAASRRASARADQVGFSWLEPRVKRGT